MNKLPKTWNFCYGIVSKIRNNLTEHMQIEEFVSKFWNKETCYIIFLDKVF